MTARIKISELPAASTLTGAEQVPLVQGGETRRTTVAGLPGWTVAVTFVFPAGVLEADSLMSVPVPFNITLPAGLPGSTISGRVAATGTVDFSIRSVAANAAGAGTEIATASITGAATNGAFTLAADVDVDAGEVLLLRAPSSPDATLADVAATLVVRRR
jgi:hypothetical protein